MKLTTKIGSLAVVGLFSVTTLAQVAVRPRPRTEVKPGSEATMVKPTEATRGKGLEQGYKADDQKPSKLEANACSPALYATELAAGTRVPAPVVQAAIEANIIRGGKAGCTEVTKMGVNARENLDETGECMLNKGAAQLAVNSPARNDLGAGCLAEAKNNDQGAVKTTAQQEASSFAQLRDGCQYIQ